MCISNTFTGLNGNVFLYLTDSSCSIKIKSISFIFFCNNHNQRDEKLNLYYTLNLSLFTG
jgi:hypothetical protein